MTMSSSQTRKAAVVAATVILTAVGTVVADARPSTRGFTCGGLLDFVDARGAVVMNHRSSSLYQRFVSSRSYCELDEITQRFSVPTRSGRCVLRICKSQFKFKGGGRD
ncbi:MAG: hypothetical protein AAFO73_09590 [Pseudomonadota bacterium]